MMNNRENNLDLPAYLKLNVEWAQDMYDDFYGAKSPDDRRLILAHNGVPQRLISVAKELFI